MWIKICGMTTPEAVAAALEARVDAIGFVFAKSPRQVTPERALQLAAAARGRVQLVAVTLHPTQQWVDEIVSTFEPDWLQTDAEDLPSLKLPAATTALPVLRDGARIPDRLPNRLMFEGPASGLGLTCDWTRAQQIARRADLVLAGGLNENNVTAAIEAVRPFGVDVSSGVEIERGIKDPERIARFVQTARAAFHRFEALAV